MHTWTRGKWKTNLL